MHDGRAQRQVVARMSRAIQDELMDLILERQLQPGDLLPTEPELVEELGVSRNSVREALKALQALDIVEIRHGYGTYVGRLSLEPLTNGLTFRTLQGIGGNDIRAIGEILEVREVLEDGLIRRVAMSIPDEDLAALAEVVKAMAAKARAGETFPDEDRDFHEILYRSLDNQFIGQLLRAFWTVFNRVSNQLGGHDPDPAETARRHRAIYTALRGHDVERAQKAMADHFRNIDNRVTQFAPRTTRASRT
ncbi:MAG: FadR family transcriptional regulator [Mycobacterium sp.]|nr:FadR family transcriptional regulator [Mycobacterium sp.]